MGRSQQAGPELGAHQDWGTLAFAVECWGTLQVDEPHLFQHFFRLQREAWAAVLRCP